VNPLYIAAAVVFALIASFGAGYHFGGLGCQLVSAKATITQDTKVQKQESADATRINQEAAAFEQAPLDPIAAPVVRVQYREASACVPRAPATGSGAHAAAPVSAPGPADPVSGPDIGRPLVLVGHTCDAQVAGLQDYIAHVCRVKTP
jgi:hypothetical protein